MRSLGALQGSVKNFERGYLLDQKDASETKNALRLQTLHFELGYDCYEIGLPFQHLIETNLSRFKPKETLSISFLITWPDCYSRSFTSSYLDRLDTVDKMVGTRGKLQHCVGGKYHEHYSTFQKVATWTWKLRGNGQ